MEYTNEETKDLATRVFAHQLILRALFEHFPDLAAKANLHVDALEGRVLYDEFAKEIPLLPVIDVARRIIAGSAK